MTVRMWSALFSMRRDGRSPRESLARRYFAIRAPSAVASTSPLPIPASTAMRLDEPCPLLAAVPFDVGGGQVLDGGAGAVTGIVIGAGAGVVAVVVAGEVADGAEVVAGMLAGSTTAGGGATGGFRGSSPEG
jgi:hypothetical protein